MKIVALAEYSSSYPIEVLGEPYVRIWLPIRSGRVTRQGYQSCTVMNNHSATFIQPDGSLKGMGKGLQDPEKMLGLAAYRVSRMMTGLRTVFTP